MQALSRDSSSWMLSPANQGPSLDQGPGVPISPARTFASMFNMQSHVYSARWDEARRNSVEDSQAMLRDAYFRALLQERIAPLTRWNWEIKADPDDIPDTSRMVTGPLGAAGSMNPKDPYSEERERVAKGLTACVRRTKQFQDMRQYHGMSIWYGRYGSQLRWDQVRIAGETKRVVGWHEPINGDKIHYTFEGQPCVMVSPLVEKREGWDVRTLDTYGPVLVLKTPELRQNFIFSAHQLEDADYMDAQAAGRRYGVGVRDFAYWAWWLRDEMLGWLMSYMEKVGSLGILVFFYNESNKESKAAAEAAAGKVGNGNALAIPVKQNDPRVGSVELLPANMTGVGFLKEIIGDYFERHIERLIVGQSMSSGQDKGDGLGGTGRAKFAENTKFNLLAGDADRQQDAFTDDLVGPLKQFNYPSMDCRYLFRYVLPDPELAEKLEAGTKLVSAGVTIKTDELREQGGYTKPGPEDETVGGQPKAVNPLTGQPLPGQPGQIGSPGEMATNPTDWRPKEPGNTGNSQITAPGGNSDWRPAGGNNSGERGLTPEVRALTPEKSGDWRPTPETGSNGVQNATDWRPTTKESQNDDPNSRPTKPENASGDRGSPATPTGKPANGSVDGAITQEKPVEEPAVATDWRPKPVETAGEPAPAANAEPITPAPSPSPSTPAKPMDWSDELPSLRGKQTTGGLTEQESARLAELEQKLAGLVAKFQTYAAEVRPGTYRGPLDEMPAHVWWDQLSHAERRVVLGHGTFHRHHVASGLRGFPAYKNSGESKELDRFVTLCHQHQVKNKRHKN